MVRHLLAVPVAVAVLALGGCSSAGNSASPGPASSSPSQSSASGQPGSSSPTPAASSPSLVQLQDFTVCSSPAIPCTSAQMVTEPSTLTLSADGSSFLADVTWSGWATATATGTGTLKVNDCNPDCVSGTEHPYAATITLTNPTAYGAGLQAYANMTVTVSDPSYDQSFSQLVP